jgi:presequence protease
MGVKHHPTFEHIATKSIPSLNLEFSEYRHPASGCVHYHLSSDNTENVFLVGLHTVPTDSSGVAHILEHTVLCGSEKYPVRDPFFLMLRRSLNTFMNAFTSSDWTAYPFASQNKKDFNNLLKVYLDAVFFARLDPLDFAQEGHRLEFEDNDSSKPLVYKGVVFNEMKGAMSSPTSKLWHTITKHLFPTVTYHFNSGGEPENIPDLSYAELIEFYKKHYHPSNAIFMTYGNIPAHEHQAQFESLVLSRFNHANPAITVANEVRFAQPKTVEAVYAYDDTEQVSDKTHTVLAWLLGDSNQRDELFEAEFISHLLLNNSASPLLHALETTSLGSAPSPLCGIDDSGKETFFICGIEGSNPEHAEQVEQLILQTLTDVATQGISEEQQQAVLHQLELHHREVTGGNMPYGLQLILTSLTAAIHRGDPAAMLDTDAAIAMLREKMSNPSYIPDLINKYFLQNPHRLRLCLKPDMTLSKTLKTAEAERLQRAKDKLSKADAKALIKQAIALKERQDSEDDPLVLPKVTIADIPKTLTIARGHSSRKAGTTRHQYAQPTNGLLYLDVIKSLPCLSAELLALTPYYNYCFAELGCSDKSYLETQAWQASISGGIGHNIMIRGDINDAQTVQGCRVISGKALLRHHQQFYDLIHSFEHKLRFDEQPRIRELMAQFRAQREHAVVQNGHTLAMSAASSGLSPVAALSHQQYGLLGLQQLKTFEATLDEAQELEKFSQQLTALHQALAAAPSEFLMIAEQAHMDQLAADISRFWPETQSASVDPLQLARINTLSQQLWITNTQVNFCAKAYPAVPINHPDAAALTVLGGFLRNGYLHRTIREQGGAYGGGASFDSESASFRFYSYRDPRVTETLDEFDNAVDWLLANDHPYAKIEEAILGVISSMDKPSSPAGEAKKTYYNARFGRDRAQRARLRAALLDITSNDLRRVGETYLIPNRASCAVITNSEFADSLPDLGLTRHQL